MATFIVKYTVTSQRLAIVEATDEANAKLVGTEEGIEVGNVVTGEHLQGGETITPTHIDEVEYKDV